MAHVGVQSQIILLALLAAIFVILYILTPHTLKIVAPPLTGMSVEWYPAIYFGGVSCDRVHAVGLYVARIGTGYSH